MEAHAEVVGSHCCAEGEHCSHSHDGKDPNHANAGARHGTQRIRDAKALEEVNLQQQQDTVNELQLQPLKVCSACISMSTHTLEHE